jgi:hypothetical protein
MFTDIMMELDKDTLADAVQEKWSMNQSSPVEDSGLTVTQKSLLKMAQGSQPINYRFAMNHQKQIRED